MVAHTGGRDDGIVIGWVKLTALERHGCNALVTGAAQWHHGLSSASFPDLFSGLSGPWCIRAHSEPCHGCGSLASLSNIFCKGVGRKKEGGPAIAPSASSLATVAFTPARGTYAYDVLQCKFKELDVDNRGYISEGDLKVALKRLNLPASEEDIQYFLNKVVDTTWTKRIMFENFAEYAIQRENELVDTFKGLDKRKTGYITVDEMKTALQKYKFRLADKDIEKMVSRFHVRGGISRSRGFYHDGQVLDFAEFRELLMLSSLKDMRDPFQIWGRAIIDLGDVDTSFPLSAGRYHKMGQLGQRRPKKNVLRHLLAGAASAAVSRTVVAPLERIKVVSMVNFDFAKEGFPFTFSKLWREEGVEGLFRGNFLNLLRIAPTKILEYLVYDNLKEIVLKRTEKVDIGGTERVLLGSIASMAGTFISHPIDTVRTVLIVQVGGAKRGIFESTKAIIKDTGFAGFYKGIIPNMIRVAPYAVINFVVYDELKQWYRKKIGPGGELGLLSSVCCGVVGGAAAQIALYPLETVQRRLQAQAAQQSPIIYQNMVDAFQIIIQDEGARALYAGLLPNTLKLVPAAAVSFLVYEALQKMLELKE